MKSTRLLPKARRVRTTIPALLCLAVTATSAAAMPTLPHTSQYVESSTPALIQIANSQDWYEGGTLHAATMREWTRASRANQLATAADWAVGILGGAKARQIGKEGWRVYANGLVTCINTAAVPDMMEQSVSELAAACSILMEMQ